MLHVSLTKNEDGTRNNQICARETLEGYVAIPKKLEDKATSLLPFINLIMDDGGNIADVVDDKDARNAPIPIDKLRVNAIDRIDGKCSAAIYSGVAVGNKHYKLTATAQGNLATAQAKVDGGAESVIYAADNEEPTLHTAAQITAISDAAYKWGIVNTSYYAKLQKWIARETDTDVLAAIDYGSKLPDDLMQELGTLLSGVGINLADYKEMLTS